MARFEFYHSQEWKRLRQYIIQRDGGTCQLCGAKGDTVHHIVWIDDSNCSDPNVTMNPDNLITVCVDCHAKLHSDTGSRPTQDNYIFDNDGNLIYIKENKNDD